MCECNLWEDQNLLAWIMQLQPNQTLKQLWRPHMKFNLWWYVGKYIQLTAESKFIHWPNVAIWGVRITKFSDQKHFPEVTPENVSRLTETHNYRYYLLSEKSFFYIPPHYSFTPKTRYCTLRYYNFWRGKCNCRHSAPPNSARIHKIHSRSGRS